MVKKRIQRWHESLWHGEHTSTGTVKGTRSERQKKRWEEIKECRRNVVWRFPEGSGRQVLLQRHLSCLKVKGMR